MGGGDVEEGERGVQAKGGGERKGEGMEEVFVEVRVIKTGAGESWSQT